MRKPAGAMDGLSFAPAHPFRACFG